MKILSIVESAYRGTIEEQDDTILWLNHIFQNGGAEVSVLLRGNSVNYLLKNQDASGLQFGGWKQTNPPELDQDLTAMLEKGIAIYAVAEDVRDRGLPQDKFIAGIQLIPLGEVAELCDRFEQVWHW
ncbi:DsrE family protein [Spirulina sp. 06S082]|uniref:DsrE family protein n=1 Tax=Spirulina sp. 06S082 TaxID=3110248 RepID=UPI002B213CDD|nr:DsrE family protein [Spirulina sp. 06S082]MEA5469602.1 DsrE family protein [Spirulina sp. 06S082]